MPRIHVKDNMIARICNLSAPMLTQEMRDRDRRAHRRLQGSMVYTMVNNKRETSWSKGSRKQELKHKVSSGCHIYSVASVLMHEHEQVYTPHTYAHYTCAQIPHTSHTHKNIYTYHMHTSYISYTHHTHTHTKKQVFLKMLFTMPQPDPIPYLYHHPRCGKRLQSSPSLARIISTL